ncbi:CRISPR-associated exonuclease Cas4 [Ruminococcaceae bacterium BL-4]|jgi:CRISPR-associated exonuclease Cas4|nr:CRISPR-associated exonuclease Cas4 [Ruminococcaceae bacterium BL-4]
METDCSWAENVFVCKGNLIHENVDAGKCGSTRGAITERSIKVYNDNWGLFGVIDCLELRRSSSGSFIEKYNGRFVLTIVEYKVRSPKTSDFRREDAMQLLAQKICADDIFKTNCRTFFYYADTRKRIRVDFCEDDYDFLRLTLSEMKALRDACVIPPIRDGQYCGGCSLKDICMPKGEKRHHAKTA